MKELVPKLKELVGTADEVGAKAAAEKLIKPEDIFDKFHPGPKKTPKEIEDEKKAAEKGAAKEEKKAAPKEEKKEEKKAAEVKK